MNIEEIKDQFGNDVIKTSKFGANSDHYEQPIFHNGSFNKGQRDNKLNEEEKNQLINKVEDEFPKITQVVHRHPQSFHAQSSPAQQTYNKDPLITQQQMLANQRQSITGLINNRQQQSFVVSNDGHSALDYHTAYQSMAEI